mgnify:CR=1 FL=1
MSRVRIEHTRRSLALTRPLRRPLTATFAALCVSSIACLPLAPQTTPLPNTILPNPVQPDPTPRAPLGVVALSPIAGDAYAVEGVAIDDEGNARVLLPGDGIVTLDAEGAVVSRHAFYSEGLDDFGYSDLDVLPDGRLALAAPNEVVVYDPAQKLVESYFCLEPGFGEIVMVNQSVAVDPTNDRVFAAPAFYDSTISFSTPQSAFHARYSLDGEFVMQVDVLSTQVVAEGLAFDVERDRLLAVDGDRLSIFKGDGTIERAVLLEEITDASGLAIDEANGQLLVTDRADMELRRFALDEL